MFRLESPFVPEPVKAQWTCLARRWFGQRSYMSEVSSSRGAAWVAAVPVEVCVDAGTGGAVAILSRLFSDDLSLRSAGPEGAGGDMNSMLDGRGLGCGGMDFDGDNCLLRGEPRVDGNWREDGDAGVDRRFPLPSAPMPASDDGAGDSAGALSTNCFSFPLLSVLACLVLRGVMLREECGAVLAGFALLQSSFGTLIGLLGPTSSALFVGFVGFVLVVVVVVVAVAVVVAFEE